MKKILTIIISLFIVVNTSFSVFADENAYAKSLAKTDAMIDYLNEVYLGKYPELAFDIDYCSPEDIELLTKVANYITTGCATDEEKAEAIYNWMINNISYGQSAFSPIDVYKRKEGLCSGQSQLMSTLFRVSGIPSAVVRCSKQGTQNIESLELSNYYLNKKQHEFVMAYVDNGWYGYDSVWKSSKMDREHVADQYVVLHVDGILTYSEEAWDFSTISGIETWYIDGEYLTMDNGEIVESGGSILQVGGCLVYNNRHYNSNTSVYYSYQGEGTNKVGHAYLGGYYLTHYINSKDVILVQENGMLEDEYFEYNGNIYIDGVKVQNVIPDLGFTNKKINMYVGETIDFSSIYEGYTLSGSNLTIEGAKITATTPGETTLTINGNGMKYKLRFNIQEKFVLDELSQELCDHDHTFNEDEHEFCAYCGKEIVEEKITVEDVKEEVVEQEEVTELETEEEIIEEVTKEETHEVVEETIKQVIETPVTKPEVIEEVPEVKESVEEVVVEETQAIEETPVEEEPIEEQLVEKIQEQEEIVEPVLQNIEQEQVKEVIEEEPETLTIQNEEKVDEVVYKNNIETTPANDTETIVKEEVKVIKEIIIIKEVEKASEENTQVTNASEEKTIEETGVSETNNNTTEDTQLILSALVAKLVELIDKLSKLLKIFGK